MEQSTPTHFKDREEAAIEIANRLERYRNERPLILGVPRGAVLMAKRIAEKLGGDLDIVLVHKVGHPMHPEFAVASVTEEGEVLLGEGAKRSGVSAMDIEPEALREISDLQKKRAIFTPRRRPVDPTGRTVVIVDDGIATGATMVAAVHSLKLKGAKRIIVATPVASRQAVELLESEGVEVCAPLIPKYFFSVAQFYDDFRQISDREVIDALSSVMN